MKGVFNISVLLLGFIVTSCVNDPKRHDNVRVITVDITKQTDISEFVSSFDGYVCLETTDDCLISGIKKLKSVGDTIYISDDSKIAMFSRRDGYFLGKIHKHGRGPGEYITLTDFDVFDSRLYVLSNVDREIIMYNASGDVLRTINTGEGFSNLSVIDEDNIWLYSSDSNDSMYNFILIGTDADVKAKYDKFSKNQSYTIEDITFCGSASDTLYVSQYYDNIVYSLHYDGYVPLYRFDMNLQNTVSQEELSATPLSELHKTYKYKESFRSIMHIDRSGHTLFAETLCFLDGLALKTCLVKADIETGVSNFYICSNEVDERFPLFDLSNVIGYDGKVLISYLTAFSAKKYGKKYKIGNLADISEYDNPVIVFHTLNY
ncbi:MAG: 6-bladed beta-propeller [Bacteroidales bacterium]|nr:6-bladed beta-propeller [Bacteroidales bacterium]